MLFANRILEELRGSNFEFYNTNLLILIITNEVCIFFSENEHPLEGLVLALILETAKLFAE